jgi:two-component system cell cycle response regulator DivK
MPAETVLIVEDNRLNRKLMSKYLKVMGFTVLEAEDGETGVAMAREHNPDLILMDIGLPKISGLEAAKQIKMHPELAGTPVVVITGHDLPHYRERAQALNCVAFIAKPFKLEEFKRAINEAMQR